MFRLPFRDAGAALFGFASYVYKPEPPSPSPAASRKDSSSNSSNGVSIVSPVQPSDSRYTSSSKEKTPENSYLDYFFEADLSDYKVDSGSQRQYLLLIPSGKYKIQMNNLDYFGGFSLFLQVFASNNEGKILPSFEIIHEEECSSVSANAANYTFESFFEVTESHAVLYMKLLNQRWWWKGSQLNAILFSSSKKKPEKLPVEWLEQSADQLQPDNNSTSSHPSPKKASDPITPSHETPESQKSNSSPKKTPNSSQQQSQQSPSNLTRVESFSEIFPLDCVIEDYAEGSIEAPQPKDSKDLKDSKDHKDLKDLKDTKENSTPEKSRRTHRCMSMLSHSEDNALYVDRHQQKFEFGLLGAAEIKTPSTGRTPRSPLHPVLSSVMFPVSTQPYIIRLPANHHLHGGESVHLSLPFLVNYQLGGKRVVGTLYLTNYRLLFVSYNPQQEEQSSWNIPIAHILTLQWKETTNARSSLIITQKDRSVIILRTSPFLLFSFRGHSQPESRPTSFPWGKSFSELWSTFREKLEKLTFINSHSELFAFSFTPHRSKLDDLAWGIYDPISEYKRVGLLSDSNTNSNSTTGHSLTSQFRLTEINKGYRLCQTYPECLVVPAGVSDEQLVSVASFRSKERLPAICWVNKDNGACIARCSQPLVGVRNQRNHNDEHYFNELRLTCERFSLAKTTNTNQRSSLIHSDNTVDNLNSKIQTDSERLKNLHLLFDQAVDYHPSSSSSALNLGLSSSDTAKSKLFIIDARPHINALSNCLVGKGYEDVKFYTNSEIRFQEIPNIHQLSSAHISLHSQLVSPSKGSLTSYSTMLTSSAEEEEDTTPYSSSSSVSSASSASSASSVSSVNSEIPNSPSAPIPISTSSSSTSSSFSASGFLKATASPSSAISPSSFVYLKESPSSFARVSDFEILKSPPNTATTLTTLDLRSSSSSSELTRGSLQNSGESTPPAGGTSAASTEWQLYISRILRGALLIAQTVAHPTHPSSVVVHCSDGWDRTSQLLSLSEIILDPYYRSLRGFAVLIEKEWISFGHKFSSRCGILRKGHGNSASSWVKGDEISPIFMQFLDCVWQMVVQMPDAFELNEQFLLFLVRHVYSCKYGTFLGDSEKEKKEGFHDDRKNDNSSASSSTSASAYSYSSSSSTERKNDNNKGKSPSETTNADNNRTSEGGGIDKRSQSIWWVLESEKKRTKFTNKNWNSSIGRLLGPITLSSASTSPSPSPSPSSDLPSPSSAPSSSSSSSSSSLSLMEGRVVELQTEPHDIHIWHALHSPKFFHADE